MSRLLSKLSQSSVSSTAAFSRTSPMTINKRHIGFLDTIKDKFASVSTEKKQEQMDAMFSKTREKLLSTPKFRLKEYYLLLGDTMKDLDGWKGKVSAMAQKEETDAMKRTYSLFAALTDIERANENLNIINFAVKTRVTAATGITTPEINVEIRKFEELRMFHAWLHRRVEKGLSLPATQADSLTLMRDDPPTISSKMKQQLMTQQKKNLGK